MLALALPHPKSSHAVATVSIGVSSVVPRELFTSMAEGDLSVGMTELPGRADQALYEATAGVPNRVLSGRSSKPRAQLLQNGGHSVTLRAPSSPAGGMRGIENSKSVLSPGIELALTLPPCACTNWFAM